MDGDASHGLPSKVPILESKKGERKKKVNKKVPFLNHLACLCCYMQRLLFFALWGAGVHFELFPFMRHQHSTQVISCHRHGWMWMLFALCCTDIILRKTRSDWRSILKLKAKSKENLKFFFANEKSKAFICEKLFLRKKNAELLELRFSRCRPVTEERSLKSLIQLGSSGGLVCCLSTKGPDRRPQSSIKGRVERWALI